MIWGVEFFHFFKVLRLTLTKMKCSQQSSKLKWYRFPCVSLYIDFDGFKLPSADRYILRAHKRFTASLAIFSFYGNNSKQRDQCIANMLWLNKITVNEKIVKAVFQIHLSVPLGGLSNNLFGSEPQHIGHIIWRDFCVVFQMNGNLSAEIIVWKPYIKCIPIFIVH